MAGFLRCPAGRDQREEARADPTTFVPAAGAGNGAPPLSTPPRLQPAGEDADERAERVPCAHVAHDTVVVRRLRSVPGEVLEHRADEVHALMDRVRERRLVDRGEDVEVSRRLARPQLVVEEVGEVPGSVAGADREDLVAPSEEATVGADVA